jgi:hypothetical protein
MSRSWIIIDPAGKGCWRGEVKRKRTEHRLMNLRNDSPAGWAVHPGENLREEVLGIYILNSLSAVIR